MGATEYEIAAVGTDIQDAFNNAVAECRDRNGHQDGYSGDIQTSNGFVQFQMPARVSTAKFLGWMWGDAEVPAKYALFVKSAVRVADEKRGNAAALIPNKAEMRRMKKELGAAGTRKIAVVFVGTGAC